LTGPGDNPLEAVYRYQHGRWAFAHINGAGSFNTESLVSYHIPRSIARRLISKMNAIEGTRIP
jgi:hypothetical protein